MKKTFLFLVMLMISAAPALAFPNWVQVSKTQYVDRSSIRHGQAYGTYLFNAKAVAVNKPFETYNGRSVWQVNGSLYIDCRDRYIREISYSLYDSNNSVIVSKKSSGNQWRNIQPGVTAYPLYNYVCNTGVTAYDPYYYDVSGNYYYNWWD